METITYKAFDANDLTAAWALIEALKAEGAEISFTDYESAEDLKAWLDNPHQLVYAAKETNGSLLALVRGKRDSDPEKQHAAFLTAATAMEARGKGIAAKLTHYALGEMKAEGVELARIYVYSDNHASLAAVGKLGFDLSGKVVAHHRCPKTGEFVDDLIFHKWL